MPSQIIASLRSTVLNLHRLASAKNIAEACRTIAFGTDRASTYSINRQIIRSQAH